jgi:hypothetical protein
MGVSCRLQYPPQCGIRGRILSLAFFGSFRGLEVFLTDLYGLSKYLDSPRQSQELSHVIIPLLACLKNENGEKYHLTPVCLVTSSGLQVETWVRRLVQCQAHFGRVQGPAFTTLAGAPAYTSTLEMDILDRFHAIQARRRILLRQTFRYMSSMA